MITFRIDSRTIKGESFSYLVSQVPLDDDLYACTLGSSGELT
jgi:hypothetical protein